MSVVKFKEEHIWPIQNANQFYKNNLHRQIEWIYNVWIMLNILNNLETMLVQIELLAHFWGAALGQGKGPRAYPLLIQINMMTMMMMMMMMMLMLMTMMTMMTMMTVRGGADYNGAWQQDIMKILKEFCQWWKCYCGEINKDYGFPLLSTDS